MIESSTKANNPYLPTLIILSGLTLALFVIVWILSGWFSSLGGGGAAVERTDHEHPRGFADAFVVTLKLTPVIALVAVPVWAIVLFTQAGMLKKKRSVSAD